MRREILILMALATGCGRHPGTYAPPPQRSLELGTDPGFLEPFVFMDNPAADDYIVRDISPERGFRRWAFLHPELRFQVKETRNLKFVVEFDLPEVTYKVTGPVSVSAAVNGHDMGSIRCDRAGGWRMEKPVPEGVVKAGEEIHVTFEANPKWVSPEDGAQLSFFLRGAGFTQ